MKNLIANHCGVIAPALTFRSYLLLLLFLSLGWLSPDSSHAQSSIFRLMDTTGLTIHEIENLADQIFKQKGKGRGSGYKQFQRWLYEEKFHVDQNGYFISRDTEDAAFKSFMARQPEHERRMVPWTELGPDYWSPTEGWNPGNGRITSVAVQASNNSIMYVSSPGGGIWKTTNGGTSWNPLIDFENAAWMDVFNLAIDPANPTKVYAGLSEGGVLKSTSSGSDWEETGSGPQGVRKIVVHPTNTNIILVASSTGVHRSTNGGNTWAMVSSNPMEDIEFKPGDPTIVYASGSGNGVAFMRSTNNGTTWTNIGSSNGITHVGRSMIAVSAQNPAVVYVVQASAEEFGRLYRSTNSGQNFITTISGNSFNGTNFFGYESDGTGEGGQADYDMAICANPANADQVYIAGIICWKSVNGGSSFTPLTEWFYDNTLGYNHADVHALEYIGSTIYSGSDGGVYKSTNAGGDWIDLSEGLGIRQIYRLSCSEQNPQVICFGSQDNGTSIRKPNGAWIDWLGADGMDNVISPINTNVIFGMTQLGSLYKTTDGGMSLIDLPEPDEGNWVTPLCIDPNNQDILYGGWNGVYKTTNGGNTWTKISVGAINDDLDVLAIAPSNTNFIYASVGNTLYRTSNGGSSWTSVNAGGYVSDIYVSESNAQKIWIALSTTSGQVKVSENMGTNFTDLSSGLPSLQARCIVVDEEVGGNDGLYLGMNIGVYNRSGGAWSIYEEGLPLVPIRDMEMVKSADLIRVATYGRGIWEAQINSTPPVTCPESCCNSFIYDYSQCSDFENYSNGNITPQGTPPFYLFSNQPNEQATVTTLQSFSGTKSLRFGSTSDIVFDVDRTIFSVTRLEWMMYIPSGKAGSFGFYTSESNIYPLFVKYNSGTATMYRQTSPNTSETIGTFSYTSNAWFKSVLIFFPSDRIEFWQNSTLRQTISNYQTNAIGHLNFYYNNTGSTDFYIDDICYKEHFSGFVTCSQDYVPVCVNGTEFPNECYASDAGYSACEWTEGVCELVDCNPCDDCFWFQPRYQASNTVDFLNRFCGGGDVNLDDPSDQHRSGSLTFQWNVPEANEQYTSGTSSTSENPSIIFPGPGTYTVCEVVFSSGIQVFSCCHEVVIGGCITAPVAFYTSQFALFNKFILNADHDGNQVEWTFSSPDVFIFEGTPQSPQIVIEFPEGSCVMVCLYVTNACGTSSYCTELCFDHPTCSGNTPPVYITEAIELYIENTTVEIELPSPPSGQQAVYAWDFGDGNTSSNQNVSHTYDDPGNYTICLVITIGCRTWCYCWCIHINPCEPTFTTNEGQLTVEFIGTENNLQYLINASEPIAQGQSWLVNNVPVSGGSTSLSYTFPGAGNYTVCFPYFGNDGCVHYYCIDIGVGNPFICNTISWKFVSATGYQFSLPSGSSDIQWTIDETNQQIGQGINSNWVLPVSPCNWRTISVRYFDGIRYRICCLRIYLCPPDECFGSIDYGYLSSSDQATFKLNSAGSTDITWYFDDTPTQTLGTTSAIVIPYPGNCVSRWISVKYRDNTGRWRICCRLIYFCNPVNCNIIRINYTENSGYRFSVDQAYESMSWILEETGTSLGTGLQSAFVPVGANCDYRTVSLRYWIPGLGWQLCCLRFYWCDPTACGDLISFTVANNTVTLVAPDNLQQVTWFRDNTILGTTNTLSTNLSSVSNHKIYIRYFDPCDNSWKWCYREYTSGGITGNLTFDFDNSICGEQNQIVEIPLRVRGFEDMINFQFSIQLEDTTKGKLLEVFSQNLPGDFEDFVNNAATGSLYWENPSATDIPDNTIIAIARIRIVSSVAGETDLNITGTPVAIYAEDVNGNIITPVVRSGSFCFEQLVDVCGTIMREDFAPIANVNVSLHGCKRYTAMTDANGDYCFTDVPAGATYEVSASKDTNYKNGVNSGDLSAIKRHILGIQKLNTPYKILAADARQSNAVNAGDVSELRRLILGHIVDLPTCESWVFTDRDYLFPTPADPFSSTWPTGVVLQNIQSNVSDADLIGWKMGDVNNSNNPQGLLDNPILDQRGVADIHLIASSIDVHGVDTFSVSISTRLFDRIRAGQFSVRFDPDKFTLLSVGEYHPLLGLNQDNFILDPLAGFIGFIWDDATGVTLPDDAVMYTIQFMPKLPQIDLSEVSFSQDPVSYYFENEDGEELNVITTIGEVTVPVLTLSAEDLLISPNPVKNELNISASFQFATKVKVELINELGVPVRQVPESGSGTTKFSHQMDLGDLPAGLYFVRVLTEAGVITRRIIHL